MPLVATALLVAALLIPAVSVRAVTSAGATVGLVNTGQLVRDASSAVPAIGFGMTSSNPNDALDFIIVRFTGAGFDPGDDNDLRRLNVDSRVSGVGFYRDTGPLDDILDAGDVPVTADGIAWVGADVEIDLTGHAERLPAAVVGQYHWIIVVRTSDVPGSLVNGNQIVATVPAGGIRATNLDVGGFVVQPFPAAVTSNALTVRLTRTVDMLGGADRWIGPASASVNAMAVLGLSIVDGGIATNRGIDDRIQSLVLTLTETGGAVSTIDFRPITRDGGTSGIAFYLDDGTVADAWDAADTAILLASLSPAVFAPGGATFAAVFGAPGLPVPDVNAGSLDFFVVVRTANIATLDSFNLRIDAFDVTVAGTLASQAGTVDAALLTPLPLGITVVPSSDVIGDATPPRLRFLTWIEASPNLAALGLDLYFNNQMTTTQFADVAGQARDDESGLVSASFSSEPSLASSPGPMALTGAAVWRTWAGAYGFASVSTDASSPVVVTVSDAVGNTITTTSVGSDFRYIFTSQALLIIPNPGWIVPATPPFWVDPTGKLWFSNLIPGTETASVQVDLVALFGGGLANASASSEPSLAGGPRPALVTYPAGTDADTLRVDYDFTAGSADESSPVRITVFDNSGLSASRDFPYGLDAEGPAITFVSPAQGSTVSGTFTVRATVVDALTRVEGVAVEVDPTGAFQPMFFDGTGYFLPINSVLFPDGNHRIIVAAVDVVGNVHAVGIDVVFRNSAIDTTPPSAAFLTPLENALVTGTTLVAVQASDNVAVARVDLRIAGAPAIAMTFNSATGRYEYSWSTASWSDGLYRLEAIAVDGSGNVASAIPIDVKVDNTPPNLAFLAPGSNELVAGVVDVQVSALDFGGVARVDLTAGGQTVTMASLLDGTYRYRLDTGGLGSGGVAVTVVATDVVGLTATVTRQIRVDNAGPVITLIPPSSDRGAIVLEATVSDTPAGVASVVFIIDGARFTGVSDGSGSYTVTFFSTQEDNGAHAYAVIATDQLGNTASASDRFSVNNPVDYLGVAIAAAPFLIFLVLVVAFVVLLVLARRGALRRIEGRTPPEGGTTSPGKDELQREL